VVPVNLTGYLKWKNKGKLVVLDLECIRTLKPPTFYDFLCELTDTLGDCKAMGISLDTAKIIISPSVLQLAFRLDSGLSKHIAKEYEPWGSPLYSIYGIRVETSPLLRDYSYLIIA